MGDADFFKALQVYYRNYAFENASTEDFIRIVENIGQKTREKIAGMAYIGRISFLWKNV